MKPILAIDPGNVESAYCLIDPEDGYKAITFEKVGNDLAQRAVALYGSSNRCDDVVIEMVGHYGSGMPAGRDVFDTCVAIGRFEQIAQDRGMNVHVVLRPTVKAHLCGSARAKDGNVIQALKDRFGDKGTKKSPGHFYGFKADIWQAYALGVTWIDQQKEAAKNGISEPL